MKTLISLIFLLLVIHNSFAQSPEEQINKLLDDWHYAASVADENIFFGSMTENAHYIGTDENEDWTRNEMKEWSKEFFDRDSAWDFKKKERHIYLYLDGKLAWFDETLDTWMGVCRGSGIIILTNEGWKIQHYVLSVAIPNDKIDAYLKLN